MSSDTTRSRIGEALLFLLRSAYPADDCWESCRAELVVGIGLPEVVKVVSVLAEPAAFVERVCAVGAGS